MDKLENLRKAFNEAFAKYGDYTEARQALFLIGQAIELDIPELKMERGMKANKTKSELNLAPHEWAGLYKQLEAITKNGANSIRHLEGCALIILEAIEERKK